MKRIAFLEAVEKEVQRARELFPELFPSSAGVMTALTEEVGELAKAMLEERWGRVREEAVQVAAMAMRLAEESDKTLRGLRRQRVHGGDESHSRPEDVMPIEETRG
jgi:NTP pyrophosphatase (non-canonical NTP hydrolase)